MREAPPDFGILQLMTSNISIEELWNKYKASSETKEVDSESLDRHYWEWQTMRYWEAAAAVIDKNTVKPFLDDVVTHDAASGLNSYKLVNSFFEKIAKELESAHVY